MEWSTQEIAMSKPKIDKLEEPKRATTFQLQWLLEQINAKTRPIMEDQIRQFCLRPSGPILPATCRRAERLPDEYECVEDLTVGPDGEPCYVARKNDHVAVVHGEKVYEKIHHDQPDGCGGWRKHLLGFHPNGQPVVSVAFMNSLDYAISSPEELDADRRTLVYVGNELLIEEKGMNAVTLLSDGSVLYAKRLKDNTFVVIRNRETLLAPRNRKYLAFAESPIGELATAFVEGDLYVVGSLHNNRTVRVTSSQVSDIFWHENGWYFLQRNDKRWEIRSHESERLHGLQDDHGCSGQFRVLPDGRTCYTSWTRHHHACHVVDGQLQPGFTYISPLFERDGEWLYYGIIDRHLYLMELSPKTA